MPNLRVLDNALPVAPLKIVAMESAAKLGKSVDNYLVGFRKNMVGKYKNDPAFMDYVLPSYLIDAETPRFGSGEGKVLTCPPEKEEAIMDAFRHFNLI